MRNWGDFMFKFYDYKYPKYDCLGTFNGGLAIVKGVNNLFGFIDKTGKEVIPCKYKEVNEFKEDLALVKDEAGRSFFIDRTGEKTSWSYIDAEPFSEGLAPVLGLNGLWGFIDKSGNQIIPCKYKDVSSFSEGLASVQTKNDYYRYIDKNGNIVIKDKYLTAEPFKDGYAIVTLNKRKHPHAIINKKGKIIKEGEEYFISNKRILSYNEETKILTSLNIETGKQNELISSKYPLFYDISEGMMLFMGFNGKYAIMDIDLNLKTDFLFKCVSNFSNEVAKAYFDDGSRIILKKDGTTSEFSKDTKKCLIRNFNEEKAIVVNNDDFFGCIDKTGKVIIPCENKSLGNFSEGLAAIITNDGRIGYIDEKGNFKLEIEVYHNSVLILGDRCIHITAKNEEELNEKKLKLLNKIKEGINELYIETLDNVIESKTKIKK